MSVHFTHAPPIISGSYRGRDPASGRGHSRSETQTVLLKSISDSVDTLETLYHGLLKCAACTGTTLYQCDPITGSSHFRTSVDKGLEIMQGLRGHTTGYAVPTYVIDAPGGRQDSTAPGLRGRP